MGGLILLFDQGGVSGMISSSRAGQEPRAATKGAYPLGSPDNRLLAASLVKPIVPAVPPVEKPPGPPSDLSGDAIELPLISLGGSEG